LEIAFRSFCFEYRQLKLVILEFYEVGSFQIP